MPLKVDEQIPRSVMFLCLGAAATLLLFQWGGGLVSRLELNAIGPINLPLRQAGFALNPLPAKPSSASQSIAQKAQPVNPVGTTVSTATSNTTHSRLMVDLSDRRVYLYKAEKLLGSYPLAVAQEGWETPTGPFQVLDMESDPTWIHPITSEAVPPGPDNPLGVAWIGFWTDGKSEIGFHGTNQEELIGEAVSHGCLRMRNEDIETIYAHVSKGTPVMVQD